MSSYIKHINVTNSTTAFHIKAVYNIPTKIKEWLKIRDEKYVIGKSKFQRAS